MPVCLFCKSATGDCRGVRTVAGPASLQRVAESALAAYDAVAARAGARPILVFGTSLGTTAALQVAANRPVSGLFLHNPPALKELVVGDHGWWNLWLLAYPVSWQIPSALDSVRNAAQAPAPAAIVLSGADEVVGLKYQRVVANAYAGPKTVILRERARHNDPLAHFAQRER